MKMIYGGVPVNSLKVKHYEISTNDCDMIASDLQAGKTAVARGRKITGTGKSFSFASYGELRTNESVFVPMVVNAVFIGSTEYPVRMIEQMENMIQERRYLEMYKYHFSNPREIAEVIIDGIIYPLTVSVQNGEFLVSCEKTISIELFYGKDEYI